MLGTKAPITRQRSKSAKSMPRSADMRLRRNNARHAGGVEAASEGGLTSRAAQGLPSLITSSARASGHVVQSLSLVFPRKVSAGVAADTIAAVLKYSALCQKTASDGPAEGVATSAASGRSAMMRRAV